MSCDQVGCEEPSRYRYTWPGRDEKEICEKHKVQAQGISLAMGFHLQFIPLEVKDEDIQGPIGSSEGDREGSMGTGGNMQDQERTG